MWWSFLIFAVYLRDLEHSPNCWKLYQIYGQNGGEMIREVLEERFGPCCLKGTWCLKGTEDRRIKKSNLHTWKI